jgi:hypothetical protein
MSANRSATGTKKAAVGLTAAASNAKNEEPLSGWRILTTRASKQSDGLAAPLKFGEATSRPKRCWHF